MSTTFEINLNQSSCAQSLQMHYLPAKIIGDGAANVEKYFNKYTRSEEGNLINALRGFPLQGKELEIPDGYRAVVLQETRKPLCAEAERLLRVAGTFKKFKYWNYDRIPSKDDGYKQALQLLNITQELARPVSGEDVQNEVRKISAKENNQGNQQ